MRIDKIFAEIAQTTQTFSEGEETILEVEEIVVTESGSGVDLKADSDIAYGREELVDSEKERTHGDVHSSSHLANLTQRDGKVLVSMDPILSPDDINVPDMIRWIGKNTLFRLCTPPAPAIDPGHYAMMGQYVSPKPDDEFIMLSTSPAILHMGEKRMLEALEKETDSGVTVGKITQFCKVAMRQYQLGDEGLNLTAPTWSFRAFYSHTPKDC